MFCKIFFPIVKKFVRRLEFLVLIKTICVLSVYSGRILRKSKECDQRYLSTCKSMGGCKLKGDKKFSVGGCKLKVGKNFPKGKSTDIHKFICQFMKCSPFFSLKLKNFFFGWRGGGVKKPK